MKMNNSVINGYENTKLHRYGEASAALPNTVAYEDLPKVTVNGVLKSNFHLNGKLMQAYSDGESHVGVIAATRLGKTTSYVVPTVISFARQQKKRSMVLSDPKGELYKCTAETLRQEGYNVKLLNFRDYLHSECFNPLTPIFRKYQRAIHIEDEVEVIGEGDELRNVFEGKVYESQKDLDEAVERMKALMTEDVGSDIDSIATMIISTLNTRDPYWEDSARELLKAYLWAMLEDSNEDLRGNRNAITEETYSFSTILTIMATMNDGTGSHYEDNGYFSGRGVSSRAYTLAKNCILENASNTRKCVVSTFNSKISIFKESAMRLITSCNTFEMSELVDSEHPVAVFINYRDELKVHYKMISLFVQNAYTYLINHANSQASGKLESPFYFVLDEFGNFPEIKDFDTVVSACGGRNIFFILILQSYAQLNNVYGRDTAEIIRDNLNVHVFFGSNNPETLAQFSEECGMFTRISPLSALNGQGAEIEHYQLETIPLMPKSALSKFEPGECIITEANSGYVMFSKMERYFLTDEFKNLPQAKMADYVCDINPLDKKYIYVYKAGRNKYDFDF